MNDPNYWVEIDSFSTDAFDLNFRLDLYSLYYASANHGDGYESRIALYSTEGGVGSINVIEEITSTPFPEKVWISKVGYWIKTTNVPVQLNYEPFFEPGQVKRETIYRVVSAFGELPTLNSAQYRKERDGTWTQLKDFNNGYPTGTVWFTDAKSSTASQMN